jgi:hypothetical protein
MPMTVNDETLEVADQTTDERSLLPDAVVVEQANGAGAVQKLRVCGRGGERT